MSQTATMNTAITGQVQSAYFTGRLPATSRLLTGGVAQPAHAQAAAAGDVDVCIISRSSVKQKQGNSCPAFQDPPAPTTGYAMYDAPKFDHTSEAGIICGTYTDTSGKGQAINRLVTGAGSVTQACPQLNIPVGVTAPAIHELSIAMAGSGGNITSTDGLINCAGCSAAYTGGSTVTLNRPADGGGYTFSHWSGACSGSGPCTVTMNGPVGVTAHFTPIAPTVPGAPRNVTVVPGYGQATVSFSLPLYDGGAAITGYTAGVTDGASVFSQAGGSGPITVTGLKVGYRYTCSVSASNSVGSSQASLSSSGFIAASVPGAPTLTRLISGNNTLTAYFDPPASNGGARINSYVVSCTGGSVTRTASYAASPIVVSGLTNQTKYNCSVHAHNGSGNGVESPALLRAAGRRSIAPILGVILGE